MLGLGATCAAACTGEPARAAPTVQNLPPYDAAAAALLDDGFSPEIFGMSSGDSAAKNRELLRRAAAAQAIIAARVVTITRDADTTDNSLAYQLVLSPVGRPLAGSWSGHQITVEVGPKNPAFPLIDSAGTELAGRPVILFLRLYEEGGRATLHFHAEADTPAMRKAVENARALNAFGS